MAHHRSADTAPNCWNPSAMAGEKPDLSSLPPFDAAEAIAWLARVRADQFRRFLDDRPVWVEFYLEHFHGQLDAETAVDLIYGEILLREHLGARPNAEEYFQRFPEYESHLRRQALLHDVLGSEPLEIATEWPKIPGFEILAELGRGGMGVVYQARQTSLHRLVALKIVQVGASREVLARLRAEAESLAALQHASIVQIFDVGAIDGKPFFIMEYVAEGSLDRHLGGKPQPVRQAARLAETVALGVHAAHQKGIVHRDLKPANILVQRGGADGGEDRWWPKITDFGLAKNLDGVSGLTVSGTLIGTPGYMAPEQAEGRLRDIGPATDVHAVGALLYEMLTGRPPFHHENAVATLERVRNAEPTPPSRLNRLVHRDLETICLQCLQKKPAKRYATAELLARDLRHYLNGEPIEAVPAGPLQRLWSWCCRNPAQAMAGMLAAAVLFVFLPGWVWYQGRLDDAQIRQRLAQEAAANAKKARFEADHARQAALALADTQRYFALIDRVRQRNTKKPLGWTWSSWENLREAAALPTPSRDLYELRCQAAACLAGIDLRPKTLLADNLDRGVLAYNPDGTILALAQYRAPGLVFPCALWLVDAASGKMVHKFTVPASARFNGFNIAPDGARSIVFSPDGKRVFVGLRSGWVHGWAIDQTGAAPALSWQPESMPIGFLQVAQDSEAIIVASTQAGRISRWDLTKELPTLTSEFADGVSEFGLQNERIVCANKAGVWFLDAKSLSAVKAPLKDISTECCIDPRGEVLAVARTDSGKCKLWLMHASTGKVLREFVDPKIGQAHPDGIHQLRFSPDGALLLSLGRGNEDRLLRLWESASGRLLASLILEGEDYFDAAFHPSGNALVVGNNSRLLLYEIGGLRLQCRVAQQSFPVVSFAFADGLLACASHLDNTNWDGYREISAWNTTAGTRVWNDFRHFRNADYSTKLAVSTEGKEVVAFNPTWPGFLAWNTQTQEPWRNDLLSPPSELVFDGAGRLWSIQDRQMSLRSWTWPDLDERTYWSDPLRVLSGKGQLYCLAAAKKSVLVGGREGASFLFESEDGRLVQALPGISSPVCAVALNSSETLAAAGFQGKVILYRVPDGKTVAALDDPTDAVTALDFSADSSFLAVASRDGVIHLYRLAAGTPELFITFKDAGSPVRQVRFAPDGQQLAFVVQGETAVRIWDLRGLAERLHILETPP